MRGDLKIIVDAKVRDYGGSILGGQQVTLRVAGTDGDLQMLVNNLAEMQEVAAQAAGKVTQAAVFLAAERVRKDLREVEVPTDKQAAPLEEQGDQGH